MASIHWMYRIAKVGIDLTLLTAAFCLAFLARFEGNVPPEWVPVFRSSLPLVLAVQFAALQFLGTHRLAWRSVSLIEVALLFRALVVGSVILGVIRLGVQALSPIVPGLQAYLIPFGVLFIDFALAAFGIIGVRVLWRSRLERHARRIPGRRPVRTLLIGTGPASIRVARDLASRPHDGHRARRHRRRGRRQGRHDDVGAAGRRHDGDARPARRGTRNRAGDRRRRRTTACRSAS